MKRDVQVNPEAEENDLVASLRRLLKAQLAAGREGNLARVERLGERTNAVVQAIVQRGGLVRTHMEAGGDLEKLYRELILLLRAQQADVQSRLGQLRRVKRVVCAYGGNDAGVRKSSSPLG
mgnify:CR=1 FL=1